MTSAAHLPGPTEPTWARLRAPLAVGLGGVAILGALRLRDPHVDGSWGFCPFLQMAGMPCPGCGGLRAVNDLTHGNIVAALSSNALAVLLVAVLAVAWILWLFRSVRADAGPMIQLGHRTGIAVIALIAVFGVVRNLSFGAWLAP